MSISKPHHGRNGSRHVGRLRIAAAKILTKGLGFEVLPEHIQPATGRNRTDWRQDIYRFEVFTYNGKMPVVVGCYWTLASFIKDSGPDKTCHIYDGELYPGTQKIPYILK